MSPRKTGSYTVNPVRDDDKAAEYGTTKPVVNAGSAMLSRKMLLIVCILCSLTLSVIDQALDFFVGFLFYFEQDIFSSVLTFLFILLPGLFIFAKEMSKICSMKTNICKAFAYLTLTPLWAIVIHCLSFWDDRYVHSAFFFRTIEGFLEASPQLVLQLSLVFRGHWSHTTKLALKPWVDFGDEVEFTYLNGSEANPMVVKNIIETENQPSIEILGRVYNKEDMETFGAVRILSVCFSFLSVFVSAIFFNDLENSRGAFLPDSEQVHCNTQFYSKLFVSVPFFFATLIFRCVSLSVLLSLTKYWAGIVIFGLFFVNVLSSLNIGDSIGRAISYGCWSLLVPVGYNRDPAAPLGYTKLPIFPPEQYQDLEPQSDKEIKRSRCRAKHFLTSHVLASCFILAPCVVAAMIFVQTVQDENAEVWKSTFIFQHLNDLVLPLVGLSLGVSLLMVRPYHRCECSGGEPPEGNVIV